jgi:hypothetical protein
LSIKAKAISVMAKVAGQVANMPPGAVFSVQRSKEPRGSKMGIASHRATVEALTARARVGVSSLRARYRAPGGGKMDAGCGCGGSLLCARALQGVEWAPWGGQI